MNSFIAFFHENILLFGLLIVLLLIYLWFESKFGQSGGHALSIHDATLKMKEKKSSVVDIRKEALFKEGHLTGAKNIPLDQLETLAPKQIKHKEAPILVVCDSGTQASTAVKKLLKLGFKDVSLLEGGIQKWRKENLPLVTGGSS